MFELETSLLLFVFGIIGGFLAGMLGIGGGIIYVFVLKYYFQKYNLADEELVRFILSNSIVATFFAGMAGSVKQILNKNYYLREVMFTGFAGVFSGLIVTHSIVMFHWYSQDKFSIVFLLILAIFAYNVFIIKKKKIVPGEEPQQLQKNNFPALAFISTGIVTGAVSSLSGLGGGVVLIPLLSGILQLDIRKASSISLGIIPMQAFAMGSYYMFATSNEYTQLPFSFGYVVFPVLLPLLAGVVLFAPLGVKMAQKLPQQKIKFIFGMVLSLIFFKFLFDSFYG